MAAPPPRSPLAWLLIPLVAGYVVASFLPVMPGFLGGFGGLLSGATLVAAWSRHRRAFAAWPWLAFSSVFLLAGSYAQHRTQPPPDWELLPPREAKFTIQINRLFNSGDGRHHGFATIAKTESHLTDLAGRRLYFSMEPTRGPIPTTRGTRLPVAGVLETISPEMANESDFHRYLVDSGAHFQYRQVSLVREPVPSRGFFAFCANQQNRFERFLRRGSIDNLDTVNVYVAMLLGQRAELSDGQRNAFLRTGTLHLFAISGLHIGVIAFALHSLLALLRIPPKPAAVIGLSLLLCFVGITGAAPSAVRAFLMVLFFWGARFLVRAPNPVAALMNSAIFVLLLFPHQLWSPGFQLSYSVVAGILFLGLPLGQYFQERWEPFSGLPPDSLNWPQRCIAGAIRWVAPMFAVSLAATLLSTPLSIHYFEFFTPGAILLNLIMIPAAGLVIVSGFISVALNLIGLGVVATVFNHAAWLVISCMELVVKGSPGIPGLFWQAEFRTSWQGPLMVSTLLGSLLVCAHRRWQGRFFRFWVPILLFALWILLAARLTFLTYGHA